MKTYSLQTFPYDILSWSETSLSGSGEDAKALTTKVQRTHAVMMDYWNWNKNNVKDLETQKRAGFDKVILSSTQIHFWITSEISDWVTTRSGDSQFAGLIC